LNEPAYDVPNQSEIEVSLFGPGYGESVLIHVGGGKWIIVDSCVHKDLPEPTPLWYLQSLGVDVAKDVLLVVASHWHDDHFRGMSRILEVCKKAVFVCSSAMVAEEFVMLGEAFAARELEQQSGISEFKQIHTILSQQQRTMKLARASSRLLLLTQANTGLPFDASLWSLSPTDAVAALCIKQLAAAFISEHTQPREISLDPNELAVVLQLVVGSDSILLGSDLEDGAEHGWKMILTDQTRPQDISFSFKVAHHGSETGHNDDVWTKMLAKNPFAFLTPFNRGHKKLPSATDIARINKLTDRGFVTIDPEAKPVRKTYSKDVERTLKEGNVRLQNILTCRGHIRFRFTPKKIHTAKVDLFHGAKKL